MGYKHNVSDMLKNDTMSKKGGARIAPGRVNHLVESFDFDQSYFEDLIEAFTPIDEIPIILEESQSRLDLFCQAVYNKTYAQAYSALLLQSKMYVRKAFVSLAKVGNNTAIAFVKEECLGIKKDDDSTNVKVQIVSSIPSIKLDEENK